MNLYQINEAITALVDPETGEILDYDAFVALSMAREEKVENMALWYKDLTAEAKAIREEEQALASRRKVCEAKAERLKNYLSQILDGDKFKTPRVALSYRPSVSLEIENEAQFVWNMQEAEHFEFLRFAAPTPDKKAITEAIKAGQLVEGAQLVEKQNIQIK